MLYVFYLCDRYDKMTDIFKEAFLCHFLKYWHKKFRILAFGTHRSDDLPPSSQAEIAQNILKNQWYSQFDWIDFSFDLERVFCKVYKKNMVNVLFIPRRDPKI